MRNGWVLDEFDLFVVPESQQLLVSSLPILRQQAPVAAYR